MEFINKYTVPREVREKTHVHFSTDCGMDKEGNFGRGNFGYVNVYVNDDLVESKNSYYADMKELAIEKAKKLNLNSTYISRN